MSSTPKNSTSFSLQSITCAANPTIRKLIRHCANVWRCSITNAARARNRCFYCSVPPQVYLSIVEQLGASGLNREEIDGQGWSRIIVEKPFGRDYESARHLNDSLHRVFEEHQIYRIDHYLGKETVQNLLVFRLANSMFEPLWNERYVDYIQITAAESVGVEHRAGYYDTSGALRDMIQNHLLQILCVVAMEPPSSFDAESVRLKNSKCSNPFAHSALAKLTAMPSALNMPQAIQQTSASMGICRNKMSPQTRARRPLPPCDLPSTTGAGRACLSTCAPVNAFPSARVQLPCNFIDRHTKYFSRMPIYPRAR